MWSGAPHPPMRRTGLAHGGGRQFFALFAPHISYAEVGGLSVIINTADRKNAY
ncbi:hypothetical protein MIZ03_4758 [Rhodoferax lithotrophicus]|uniref:Uncharacterized protein n=1 Tax=Rhodoferax lithotrophicus TaxID=2798804 RepID=A0ABM7MUH3_9BURK|nr:hypothetical protein MIZ03_4758 [Rhodoferax sp. MIZ03]